MAEPNAQRLRVTFTVKRADNDRCIIACDPLESASTPVLPGATPTESEAACHFQKLCSIPAEVLFNFRSPVHPGSAVAFNRYIQSKASRLDGLREASRQMAPLISELGCPCGTVRARFISPPSSALPLHRAVCGHPDVTRPAGSTWR